MTFDLTLDLRQIGQGIYNYIQAGMEEAIPRWTEQAGDMMLDHWRQAASGRTFPGMTRSLNSDVYRLALERGQLHFEGNDAVVIVSAPETVQMGSGRPFNLHSRIEFGGPAYSIRDAWLRGGARGGRMGRNGQYIIIPFRHGSGESVHFQMNLNPNVKRLARGGAVTERRYQQGMANPWSSAATAHQRHHGPTTALGLGPRYRKSAESTGRGQYTWARAILAGVKRTGRAGHTQYVTFRTMSEASDPSAWVVPALPANPVAQSVLTYVRERMTQRIRDDMNQMAPGGMRP